jgi:uncharacterized membrane protein
MLLVLLTSMNGHPFPVALPRTPLAFIGQLLFLSFLYGLPVFLLLQERGLRRLRGEPSGYFGYAVACGSMLLFWTLIFLPVWLAA